MTFDLDLSTSQGHMQGYTSQLSPRSIIADTWMHKSSAHYDIFIYIENYKNNNKKNK